MTGGMQGYQDVFNIIQLMGINLNTLAFSVDPNSTDVPYSAFDPIRLTRHVVLNNNRLACFNSPVSKFS